MIKFMSTHTSFETNYSQAVWHPNTNLENISSPSNVFYLGPSRFPSFSWDKLVLRKMTEAFKKKSATELQSHDATLPVVTSAPFFHLSLLLGKGCHIRRRIVALSHPRVPLPSHPGAWQGGRPIQRSAEGSTVREKTVWELRSLIFHFQGLPHRQR